MAHQQRENSPLPPKQESNSSLPSPYTDLLPPDHDAPPSLSSELERLRTQLFSNPDHLIRKNSKIVFDQAQSDLETGHIDAVQAAKIRLQSMLNQAPSAPVPAGPQKTLFSSGFSGSLSRTMSTTLNSLPPPSLTGTPYDHTSAPVRPKPPMKGH